MLEQETFKLWMLKRTNTQHNAQCEHRSSNTRPLQTGNGPHPAVENFQRSVMSWVLAPVYSAFQITKSTLKDFSNMSLFKKVSNINSLLSYLGSWYQNKWISLVQFNLIKYRYTKAYENIIWLFKTCDPPTTKLVL